MDQIEDLTSRQATSTRMSMLGDEMLKEVKARQPMLLARRFRFEGSYEEFLRLFKLSAKQVLQSIGSTKNFVTDEDNEPMLRQLYLYMSHSEKFCGSLSKGIMLLGKYGCGKSLIMRSYAHLQNSIIKRFRIYVPMVTFESATELATTIRKSGIDHWRKREIIIDEFGREPKKVYDFGNQSRPMAELICARAELGSVTHATSNFVLETLSNDDFYGAMVGDRLRAMFNFIVVAGDSRRC